MKATREDPVRSIDFSAVNCDGALSSAILALLRRRRNPMREREIARWFRATPPATVSVELTLMVGRGMVDARRTGIRRWVLEYSASEEQ